MNEPVVTQVRAGKVRRFDAPSGSWRSAIDKVPLNGLVFVTEMGVQGDQQADRKHHGGRDKAVLAYSANHYPRWTEELGRPFGPGSFGENLVVDGQAEAAVCIGDVFRIGPVLMQVSQPRQPCRTPGHWHEFPPLMKLMCDSSRCGWYLRVLEPGWLEAPCPVVLEARPHPEWTVLRALRMQFQKAEPSTAWIELGALAALSHAWKSLAAEKSAV